MNITIYELLGKLKNGNAPRSVYYKGDMFKYDETSNDYWCNELDSGTRWLFDDYIVTDILNDEVVIYEDHTIYKPDKIEKVNTYVLCDNDFHSKGEYSLKATEIIDKAFVEYSYKINEIIDKVNNL